MPGHRLDSSSAKKSPGAPQCLQVGVILKILNFQSVLSGWALTLYCLTHNAVQGSWRRDGGALDGLGQFFQENFALHHQVLAYFPIHPVKRMDSLTFARASVGVAYLCTFTFLASAQSQCSSHPASTHQIVPILQGLVHGHCLPRPAYT